MGEAKCCHIALAIVITEEDKSYGLPILKNYMTYIYVKVDCTDNSGAN